MSRHIDRAFLRALQDGEVSAEAATRVLLDHLSQECPECRRALEELADSMGLEDLQGQPRLPGTALLRVLEKDHAERERAARGLASRLEEAGPRAPDVVQEGEVEEYGNPVLARILLSRTWEACKRRQPHAKTLALALFEVGKKLSELCSYHELSFDYRLLGLTLAANAARIADDLSDSLELLRRAEEILFDVADPGFLCDFYRVQAITYINLGLPSEAEAPLRAAERCASESSDEIRYEKVRVAQAQSAQLSGRLSEAIRLTRSTISNLRNLVGDSQETEHLSLAAQANYAYYLLDVGNPQGLDDLGKMDENLFVKYDQEARFHWIRGQAAKINGAHRSASRDFKAAYQLFTEKGFFLEGGLAVIDQAEALRCANDAEAVACAELQMAHLMERLADPLAANQMKAAIGQYLAKSA